MTSHLRPYKRIKRALRRGDLDEALESIWREEDLHQTDKRGRERVADLLVAHEGFPEIMARLLEERELTPDLDLGDAFHPMPLVRHCVRVGDRETTRLALEHGARVDLVFEGGVTLAHEAAARDHGWAIELLAAFGAEVDAPTADDTDANATPLHVACAEGAAEAVAALIEQGVEVGRPNWRGETGLHIAAMNKDAAIARLLIEAGAPLGVSKENNGRAPLHVAVNQRATEVAALLVEAGAELEARDEAGWTPLHTACARGGAEEVELLLEAGADPEARTQASTRARGAKVEAQSTAREVAEALGQRRILQLLESSRA